MHQVLLQVIESRCGRSQQLSSETGVVIDDEHRLLHHGDLNRLQPLDGFGRKNDVVGAEHGFSRLLQTF